MIRFCPRCGSDNLATRVPRHDDRERTVCDSCEYVHYEGPVLAAGALLRDAAGDRLCLVRRALDPGRGRWSFPGGFVDLDEQPAAAALREVAEETGYGATIERLLGVYNSIGPRDKRVVIVVYVACRTSEEPVAEPAIEEVSEVRWFARSELPWDEFAFPSTAHALRDYYR